MLNYLGFMLKFLGLVFFWYNVHKCFFPRIQRRILRYISYYNHDHTAGFEHGWFFCEVLRTSFIVAILSVEIKA
jgi:hypothetical protein